MADTSLQNHRLVVRFRCALSLALVLSTGLAAYWIGSFSANRAGNPQLLYIEKRYLNLGELWEDPAFVLNVPIHNITTSDISIHTFQTSCSCLGVYPRTLSVPVGETREVQLKLNLAYATSQPSPPPVQEIRERTAGMQGSSPPVHDWSVHLLPILCGPNGGQLYQPPWTLTARVRTAFSIEPKTIHLHGSLIVGHPYPSRTVTVTTYVPLKTLTATADTQIARADISHDSTDARRYKLLITPNPTLPLGPFSACVWIHGVSRDGHKLPPARVPVDGTVEEDIQASPSEVAFGTTAVGKPAKEDVLLFSLSQSPFHVQRVTLTSPTATVEPLQSALPYERQFRINYRPTTKGEHTASMTFHITTDRHRQLDVTVPLSIIAIERSIHQPSVPIIIPQPP